MRLFTAIDIPDQVRDRLQRYLTKMKPLARIHWSPVENLHITTKFIGEWPEARLAEISSALAQVAVPRGLQIAIRGTGWFPNEHRPRVLWAGVEAISDDGPAVLRELARRTDETVAALGVPVEDRPYSPHLTLARVREHSSLDALKAALAREPAEFGVFDVAGFSLYLSAAGKYTRLERFPS
jgi:2'-5' RNA ligase